jgi:hypothetical protein
MVIKTTLCLWIFILNFRLFRVIAKNIPLVNLLVTTFLQMSPEVIQYPLPTDPEKINTLWQLISEIAYL